MLLRSEKKEDNLKMLLNSVLILKVIDHQNMIHENNRKSHLFLDSFFGHLKKIW